MGYSALRVITSYFNPAGYARRLRNYREFRERLGLPLVTAYAPFEGADEPGADDADVLLRVDGADVLWQKERLLNVALGALPPECRFVAWIDCDIVMDNRRWAEDACKALEANVLVQLFETVEHLPPGGCGERPLFAQQSLAGAVRGGAGARHCLSRATDRSSAGCAAGVAWAARRDVLEEHGFYDACIVGGGDTALACAAHGCPEEARSVHRMNGAQWSRYRAWAARFGDSVAGRIGCVDGVARHLWHGDIADRRAAERHAELGSLDFDPDADIAVAESGAWRWASTKPELHRYVRGYFQGRREDGAVFPTEGPCTASSR